MEYVDFFVDFVEAYEAAPNKLVFAQEVFADITDLAAALRDANLFDLAAQVTAKAKEVGANMTMAGDLKDTTQDKGTVLLS